MATLFWSELTQGRIVCEKHKGFSDWEVVTETEQREMVEMDPTYVPKCEDC